MGIQLRKAEVKDLELMLSWENNPDFYDDLFYEGPYTLADLEQLLRRLESEDSTDRRFMIQNNDLTVGIVDLVDIDVKDATAFVSILNASMENRRKGFAKNALFLLELECEKLGITKLFAWVNETNKPSEKLFVASGYQKSRSKKKLLINGVTYLHVTLFEKWLKK